MSTDDGVKAVREVKRPWTSGEWFIWCDSIYAGTPDELTEYATVYRESDCVEICAFKDTLEENEPYANARLMSASKELYEALEGLTFLVQTLQLGCVIPQRASTLEAARAALRKANPDAFESEEE